mgnify:CR=1 FL=1
MQENKQILNLFWDHHIWVKDYFVAISNNITGEVIFEHIKNQDKTY